MIRNRGVYLALFTFVALLVAVPVAGAKTRAALPDLVVQKVSKPPKAGIVGSKLKLVVKVKNAGAADAGKSKLGVYLGKGRKHTKKDQRLKRVKVKPLAAGKGMKLKLRVLIPAKSKLGAYRLFACADDSGKVDEAKESNCRGTRKIDLQAKPATSVPSAPAPSPVAAFTMSDGLDWGFVSNAKRESPKPGDPITLNLTAGNGIPGQAGYSRASVGAEGFRSGNTTTLDFGGASNEDDGQVTLQLPFAFPFGGVKEQAISVSTNGWVSFGSPAWDYWNDEQPYDYRGFQAVVGELERGIMPYWADLDIGEPDEGSGTVKETVAPDNSWVAFQWDTNQHSNGTAQRRSFQLVLFPDGSFRFDYPGENAPGGNTSFVGYSLGTGAGSVDVVSAEGESVPSGSLQFTPNALPAAAATAAGEMTAVLPKGSSFVSADAGCSLTTAPGQFSTGLVSCAVPALGPGQQVGRTVTFATPGDAAGENDPANFRLLGTYLSGGLKLTDGDEVDVLSTYLPPTEIQISTSFATPPLEVGDPETIDVEINTPKGGLDEPTAEFQISSATLSSIEIAGEPIECTAGSSGGTSATCVLPSGFGATTVEVNFVPSGLALELKTTAKALNAPPASLGIGFAG